MLGDRVGLDERVVEVDFFGAPALLPAGPYWLAATLRCPVFLTFGLYHEPNRYDLYCEPFAERIELARGDRENAARVVGAALRATAGALLPHGPRQLVQLLPGLEGGRVSRPGESRDRRLRRQAADAGTDLRRRAGTGTPRPERRARVPGAPRGEPRQPGTAARAPAASSTA